MPTWRVCFCWILCLSAWRGPVPIVHEHGLDIQSLGSNVRLAEHAIEYHSDHLGDGEAGLHLHFVVLDSCLNALFAEPNCESNAGALSQDITQAEELSFVCDDSVGAEWVLSAEQQVRDLSAMADLVGQLSFGDVVVCEPPLSYSSHAESSFLQTQFSGASACSLLCVFLC